MLLNWKPMVLVGLLPVLDLTCKGPESIGAFVHLLMRKFHPFLCFPSLKDHSSSSFTVVVRISPTSVYQTLRRPVLLYSQVQA